MNTSAVVLVEGERSSMQDLPAALAAVPGVTTVYGVTGEWDFVVTVEVARHQLLRAVITGGLQAIEGVARTQTLVVLDAHAGAGPVS